MRHQPFDEAARALAAGAPRRTVLRGLAAAALGGFGALASRRRTEAAAAPGDGSISLLYVQNATSGGLVPNPAASGLHVLTLNGVGGQTVFFAERPERIAGQALTHLVLDALELGSDDPPNAALVATPRGGRRPATVIVELLGDRYDDHARQLAYDVRILPQPGRPGGAMVHARQSSDPPPHAFGEASLFIDSDRSPVGGPCQSNADCWSGICVADPAGVGNICVANNSGSRSPVGGPCQTDADCFSGICVANPAGFGNICVANSGDGRSPVGGPCNSDADCYSGICVANPAGFGNICVANSSGSRSLVGGPCSTNADCYSGICVANPAGPGAICVANNRGGNQPLFR